MGNKLLKIDFDRCTGCRLCELVCAVKHDQASNPTRSRIRVIKWEAEGVYVPMACQQCEDAPCANACPAGALGRDDSLGRVVLDYDKCIGCRTCVSVCPFGGAHYVPASKRVVKCDLCDGDPQCVRFCEVKAVQYVEPADVGMQRGRQAARKLAEADRQAAALLEG